MKGLRTRLQKAKVSKRPTVQRAARALTAYRNRVRASRQDERRYGFKDAGGLNNKVKGQFSHVRSQAANSLRELRHNFNKLTRSKN